MPRKISELLKRLDDALDDPAFEQRVLASMACKRQARQLDRSTLRPTKQRYITESTSHQPSFKLLDSVQPDCDSDLELERAVQLIKQHYNR